MKLLHKQQGMMLIMLVFIIGLVATGYLLHALNPRALKIEQDKKTAAALAEAKAALLGNVLIKSTENILGYLPNPDMGQINILREGDSAGIAGVRDAVVIGKFPWRSLGVSPFKDGANECLWYVVSGPFKNNPKTGDVLNWDTQGQINVVDRMGEVIVSNLAALIASPGGPLNLQNRTQASEGYDQCRGNYDARNYLEPIDAEDVIPRNFLLANNDYDRIISNDRLIFVTVDEIFDTLTRYGGFSAQISGLLNDEKFVEHLQNVSISGGKGTKNVKCLAANLSTANQRFCQDWLPMLLLTDLPPSAVVQINDSLRSCNRLLIFGGRRSGDQVRLKEEDKNLPDNYLESPNLDAFKNSGAINTRFSGESTFKANNPSQDILKCL